MPIDGVNGAASVAARVAQALKSAGEATGVGFDLLYAVARRESALDPAAKAKTSSAAGLFQFVEQTWLAAVRRYGARHGLSEEAAAIAPGADGRLTVADAQTRKAILDLRFDAAKAAALAGELIAENKAGLEKALGRAVGAAEIYAAHFLGLPGAVKLLTAPKEAQAAALFPKAAAANRAVFYDGARARTVGEVLGAIAKSMGVAQPGTDASPLETKSAKPRAYGASRPPPGFLETPERLDPPLRSARLNELPETAADSARDATVAEIVRFFALGREALKPSASPLSLAALQALDPREVWGRREERR
jgi:soluble lytic murein transglycosylase-like protein